MIGKKYKHPAKEDMIKLYKAFGGNEFSISDIRENHIDLEWNMRKLVDRKIILKVKKTTLGSVWVYKLNNTYLFDLKKNIIPKLVGNV